MSFIDKIAAAIMPPESEEDRLNARNRATSMAQGDDWLAHVLTQHREIETLFDQALSADTSTARTTAAMQLAHTLSAHTAAEEAVLYPAIVTGGDKGSAARAYEEQAMTKVELAKLELLDPMSDEWREKLAHLKGAVAHHVFEEEGTWYPRLQQEISAAERQRLTLRFDEEYGRYDQSADPAAGIGTNTARASDPTSQQSVPSAGQWGVADY